MEIEKRQPEAEAQHEQRFVLVFLQGVPDHVIEGFT
jgi:hypothetical protein